MRPTFRKRRLFENSNVVAFYVMPFVFTAFVLENAVRGISQQSAATYPKEVNVMFVYVGAGLT